MPAKNVIEVARGELSVTELPPNSNKVKYNTEYYGWEVSGPDYKWCVVGLWWVFRHAGEEQAFFGGAKTASCSTLFRWYQAQGMMVPIDEIQAGDLVFLNFRHTTSQDHLGLVESVIHSPLQVTTIEFNTSPGLEGSQDNGGCVARKIRFRSQIVGVARPEYKEEIVLKPDDLTDHWAEASCRKAKAKAVMKGYPDGSFKPDKELTRAELAVILDRLGLLDD